MSKKRHIVLRVVVNLCRLLLGAAFVFSGFVKAVDPSGTLYKFQDYLTAFGFGGWMPDMLLMLAAVLLSALEFCMGMYLLLGIRRRMSSVVALVFMVVMTPFTLYLALTDPVHDCGCFGDAWVISNWQTFGKNVVLLLAAVVVNWRNRLMTPLVTPKMRWLVSAYIVLFIFCLSVYCLRCLPVLDFRPYRVGTDIRQAMSIDGGAMPTIQDFYIEDRLTGEDLTDGLLADSGYLFVMVAPRIEQADDSYIDLLNEIYDYSMEQGYGFIALSASSDEEIGLWNDRTGGEYDFYHADEVTLKTIVRANPGLLLLRDGVIINKWSGSTLPDEYELTAPLDEIAVGQLTPYSTSARLARVLAWFVGPLMLFMVIDILLIDRKSKKKQVKP